MSPESLLSGLMEGEWVLCLGRGLHLAQGVCSSHLPSPLPSMGSKASPSKSFCQALSSVSLGREGFQGNVSNIPRVWLPLYSYAHAGHQDWIPELCETRLQAVPGRHPQRAAAAVQDETYLSVRAGRILALALVGMGARAAQSDGRGATGGGQEGCLWRPLGFLHCCYSRKTQGADVSAPENPRESEKLAHGNTPPAEGGGQAAWRRWDESGGFLGQHTVTRARAGQEKGEKGAGALGGLILSRMCKARQGWFKSHPVHTGEWPVLLLVSPITWLEQTSLFSVVQEGTLSPISLHLQSTRPPCGPHSSGSIKTRCPSPTPP